MSSNVAALILSAGYSSRMGDFKPLLPLGGLTALERTISLFRSSGVEDVRVVIGYRSEELAPLLKRLAVRTIVNSRFHDGMF
ncbi:MAG: NTP transferase domain-containing protein, partial [Desulfuromonadales bacterium]|nr:NTP transferase domain-containing protein [Desulfuromonadales bacterium]